MRWFQKRSPFPVDMLARLETLGRYELDAQGSGIDPNDVWSRCVGEFHPFATTDRAGFLAALQAAVADDRGGFATFGAARLVWELLGGDALQVPDALPLIDAGIAFKQARGLPTANMTGYEMQRINRLRRPA